MAKKAPKQLPRSSSGDWTVALLSVHSPTKRYFAHARPEPTNPRGSSWILLASKHVGLIADISFLFNLQLRLVGFCGVDS